jgi:hypothetical protein
MKLFNKLLLISLLGFCLDCNTILENPDAADSTKLLVLSSSKTSLQSGGASTRVIARLPLSAGITDVTFITSAGNFVQVGAKTVKQLADSLSNDCRFAAVTLASDATKGTVYITAEAKTVRTRFNITFY